MALLDTALGDAANVVTITSGTGLIANGSNIANKLTLTNANSLSSSNLSTAANTILKGTGSINGNTTISGKHTPGNSIGTQIITGDYTLASGSALEIEINNTSSDKIDVRGAGNLVSIANDANIIIKPLSRIDDTTSYDIITINGNLTDLASFAATSGLINSADDIERNASEDLTDASVASWVRGSLGAQLNFVDTSGDIVANASDAAALRLTVNRLSSLVQTPGLGSNQSTVANLLESESLPSGLSQVVGGIQGMPESSQSQALGSLLPETNGGRIQSTALVVGSFSELVFNRLSGTGTGGGVSSGDELEGDLNSGSYGFWLDYISSAIKQGERNGFDGYKFDYLGYAFGVDKEYGDELTIGAAIGYITGDVSGSGASVINKTALETYQASLYSSYDYGEFSILGQLSFAWNEYNSARDLTSISAGTAKAEYSGQYYKGQIRIIDNLDLGGGLELKPEAGLSYGYINISDYDEKCSSAGLSVDGQNYSSLESRFGSKLGLGEYEISGLEKKVSPRVHGYWSHEFIEGNYETSSKFNGTTTVFQTKSAKPSTEKYNLGIGADITSSFSGDKWKLSLTYDAEIKESYLGQTLLLKFKNKF